MILVVVGLFSGAMAAYGLLTLGVPVFWAGAWSAVLMIGEAVFFAMGVLVGRDSVSARRAAADPGRGEGER